MNWVLPMSKAPKSPFHGHTGPLKTSNLPIRAAFSSFIALFQSIGNPTLNPEAPAFQGFAPIHATVDHAACAVWLGAVPRVRYDCGIRSRFSDRRRQNNTKAVLCRCADGLPRNEATVLHKFQFRRKDSHDTFPRLGLSR